MEEKTLYLPTEHNDRIVAFIGSPLGLLAAWLVLINTVTFLIFGVDKLLAMQLLLAAAIALYWNFLQ